MIRVEFPKYGMSGRFKIVKTVYDVLLERFTEMELGTLSTTLSEALGIGSGSSSSYSTSGGGASYRLTKNGDVITLTGSDGSSSSVTDSDTTYGLSISGQSLSLVEGGSSSSVTIPSTSVSVTQKTTSGTNIADVTINGTTTQLFAPSGGGGGDHEELTQAEYDALSQNEKENGTVYFITDGSPVGGADYVVEQGNGYRKWANGTMEQWGKHAIGASSGTATQTINFSQAFIDTDYSFFAMPHRNIAAGQSFAEQNSSMNNARTTSSTVVAWMKSGHSYTTDFSWFAIGRWK
jgi:hypothetical protein